MARERAAAEILRRSSQVVVRPREGTKHAPHREGGDPVLGTEDEKPAAFAKGKILSILAPSSVHRIYIKLLSIIPRH